VGTVDGRPEDDREIINLFSHNLGIWEVSLSRKRETDKKREKTPAHSGAFDIS